MPIPLDEASIRQQLEALVAELKTGDTHAAAARLERLGFDRLMPPPPDRSRGPILFYDPAEDLGPERSHETGERVRECQSAIAAGDPDTALRAAEGALARWLQDRDQKDSRSAS